MNKVVNWLKPLISRFSQDRLSSYAAASSFFIMLSAVPFLMLLLALLSWLPLDLSDLAEEAIHMLPQDLADPLTNILQETTARTSATTLAISIPMIILLWTACKGILSLTNGLNCIYHIRETRNYLVHRLVSILDTIVFAVFIIFILGFIVFGKQLLTWLGLFFPFLSAFSAVLLLLRPAAALVIMFVFFLFFYEVLPNHGRAPLSTQLPGSLFSAVSWLICSYIFSYYMHHSENLAYLYGSLADIMAAMLWLYICMYLFFIGAELNWYIFPRKTDDVKE